MDTIDRARLLKELNSNWHKMAVDLVKNGGTHTERVIDGESVVYAFDPDKVMFTSVRSASTNKGFNLILGEHGYEPSE